MVKHCYSISRTIFQLVSDARENPLPHISKGQHIRLKKGNEWRINSISDNNNQVTLPKINSD